ncbi:hypothetical protein AX774_g1258 [Zancudomyces culisetae]|uniref:Uncharacterized protein n=1 Tax=Zancudomyces culisetae TaxID=1213189 RepID=A0A1R1PW55_ZANCU|nr:hypothetical protein AX774_g1258 [Zancudomyces culisetae]|eukprot:OMH85197.1 hypothetical protein AX774_g1258 [Zancudomyces culisetae]
MKPTIISTAALFLGLASSYTCGNNKNAWVNCGTEKCQVAGYPCTIMMSRAFGKNFKTIPAAVGSKLQSMVPPSTNYANKYPHPQFSTYKDLATNTTWYLHVSSQFTKIAEVPKDAWKPEVGTMFNLMNTMNTYQSSFNNTYGSLVIEAYPLY